mmetsp:Transcript_18705/g.30214  ORF Transcript_18705/g.30214 Transcript_18705/m.30214 type:complete len:203 (-) Transcript_18705:599-1207(-)
MIAPRESQSLIRATKPLSPSYSWRPPTPPNPSLYTSSRWEKSTFSKSRCMFAMDRVSRAMSPPMLPATLSSSSSKNAAVAAALPETATALLDLEAELPSWELLSKSLLDAESGVFRIDSNNASALDSISIVFLSVLGDLKKSSTLLDEGEERLPSGYLLTCLALLCRADTSNAALRGRYSVIDESSHSSSSTLVLRCRWPIG